MQDIATKIISFLMVVSLSCSLAGCGNNKKSDIDIETVSNAPIVETSDAVENENEQITASPYTIGDVVMFGSYEQDNNEDNGAEPIEWIVLDTDGAKTLLLSKYVLTEEFFDLGDYTQVTWYTSDIFLWLNSEFLNDAFSADEREQIINSEYGNVFLLSFDEAIKYFGMIPLQETNKIQGFDYICYYSQDALGIPTQSVIENNIDDKEFTQERYDRLVEKGIVYDTSVIGGVYVPYWLRTQVEGDLSCANGISDQGELIDRTVSRVTYLLNARNGVRPAIWIGEESIVSDDNDKSKSAEETIEQMADLGDSTQGISRFYGYDLPLIFSLDYDDADDDTLIYNIEDKGDYYLVGGSIICPECVSTSMGSEFETGSGRKYTVIGEESYNNDQRVKIILEGEDGQSYTIFNIPAFMMDTYTKAQYYPISTENNEYFKTIFDNVILQIDKDTVFYDGNVAGDTFETAVNNGTFENTTYSIAYDIHFAEDGSIDILTPSDIGSNGVMGWYGADTVVWRDSLD